MADEASSEEKRLAETRATAHGDGSMYGGTRNTHSTICHSKTSAKKTASALPSVMSLCFMM
jgi:3D (Asp-Asp-Asp) domain-containing protein